MYPYEFYGWYRRHYNDMPTDTTFLVRDVRQDGKWYLKEMLLSSVEIDMSSYDMDIRAKFHQRGIGIEEEHHISCVFFNTLENYSREYKRCVEYNKKKALENIVQLVLSEDLNINEIKEAIEDGRRKRNSKKKSNNG